MFLQYMHKKCVINKKKNPVVTGLKVSNALRNLKSYAFFQSYIGISSMFGDVQTTNRVCIKMLQTLECLCANVNITNR